MGFLKLIVQVFFVCVELSWVERWGPERVGAPKGGGPNPEKVGARRVGARRVGPQPRKSGSPKGRGQKWRPERWEFEGWEAQNFALFFPSPAAKFVLFFPLWGSSRGFLVVFEAPGHSNVHVWALGGPGKGGPGKAVLGKGGPGGTQHDQTKTLKPTPTPHSTNTHQHTQTHTNTQHKSNSVWPKSVLSWRAKPGAAAAARPRPLTSLKVRIDGGGVSCALSVD